MGLTRRGQGERRSRCRCTSLTTSNEEIARNPHAAGPTAQFPYGYRRRGGICCVGAARRCAPTSPASHRLASAPARRSERGLLYFHHGLLGLGSDSLFLPFSLGTPHNAFIRPRMSCLAPPEKVKRYCRGRLFNDWTSSLGRSLSTI